MVRLSSVLVMLVGTALAMAQTPSATSPAAADDGLHPRVKLETSLGDIVLELDGEKAPISVANFMQYVEDGFYSDTVFHRVMPSFMIQGGGYTADLSEKKTGLRPPIRNEWQNGLKNGRGTIAMARTNNPDSATAQFFINVVNNDRLDKPQPDGAAYAVFGKVVEGMESVDKIRDTETKEDPKLPMGKVVPVTPVVIKSAKSVGKYDKAKVAAAAKAVEDAAAAAAAKAKAAKENELSDFIKKTEDELKTKITKDDASGLQWWVLKEGNGASPKATDTVEVHYTGWLLDGKKFDSSVDRGSPAAFPLNKVVKGWTVGVGMMKVGEKRKLVIPAELGYGRAGSPPVIPPNATLVFDIELLSIK